jgi:hypothetical protein
VDVVSAKVAGIVDDLLNRAGCEVLVAEGCLDLLDSSLEEGVEIQGISSITHRRLVAVQHRGPIDPFPCQTAGLVARHGPQSQ